MPNASEKFLIVVAGPTAVGKTELSIRLAQALDTEIVSADSRQFFRELNIGTAKPDEVELDAAVHHFINSHSIAEPYSAGDFERDVIVLLDQLFESHNCVILTGGSGLYIKALLEGLDELPQPLPELRYMLSTRLETQGLRTLQEEVAIIDPVFAASTEFANPQRVVRALEVYHTSGKPFSTYQKRNAKHRNFTPILIALEREREVLYQRINRRMDLMLEAGLVDEVRSLEAYRSHHALQTVGYKEVFAFLDNAYNYDEMVRLLKQNSRRYAKRQLTWFRHQGDFTWFTPDQLEEIIIYVKSRMK